MCQEQGFDMGEFLITVRSSVSPEPQWLSTAVSGNRADAVQTCMAIGRLIERVSD